MASTNSWADFLKRGASALPSTADLKEVKKHLSKLPSQSAPCVYEYEHLMHLFYESTLEKSPTRNIASPEFTAPILSVMNTACSDPDNIPLRIQAASTNMYHNDALVIVIENVPETADLSAGHDNKDGSWTVSVDQLNELFLRLEKPQTVTLDLLVHAIAIGMDNHSATTTADMRIEFKPNEDNIAHLNNSHVIPLSFENTTSTDAVSKVLSVLISGLPSGVSLSSGTYQGNGLWLLQPEELTNLNVSLPDDFNHNLHMAMEAIGVNAQGDTVVDTTFLTVTDQRAIPTVKIFDHHGSVDQAIDLDVSTQSPLAENEALTVIISGLPAGATLSQGINNGDGSWALRADELEGLQLIPPVHFAGKINLMITEVVEEATGEVDSMTAPMHIHIS